MLFLGAFTCCQSTPTPHQLPGIWNIHSGEVIQHRVSLQGNVTLVGGSTAVMLAVGQDSFRSNSSAREGGLAFLGNAHMCWHCGEKLFLEQCSNV